MADPQNQQLWVNNDIENTATVINPLTLDVLSTVPMPADLVSLGGKAHDVVFDLQRAYVMMLGFEGDTDYVVKFKRRKFTEVERQLVGKDPHVSLTLFNRKLFVPCRNSDTVFVLNRRTLDTIVEIPVPGAHGAGMTIKGNVFYATNLPGEGSEGLFAINTRTNSERIAAATTCYNH